jgi:hypothetical protein
MGANWKLFSKRKLMKLMIKKQLLEKQQNMPTIGKSIQLHNDGFIDEADSPARYHRKLINPST